MSHRIIYLLSRIFPSRYLCIVRRVRISSRGRGPFNDLDSRQCHGLSLPLSVITEGAVSHRITYLLSRIFPSRYLCIARRVRKISSRDRGSFNDLEALRKFGGRGAERERWIIPSVSVPPSPEGHGTRWFRRTRRASRSVSVLFVSPSTWR